MDKLLLVAFIMFTGLAGLIMIAIYIFLPPLAETIQHLILVPIYLLSLLLPYILLLGLVGVVAVVGPEIWKLIVLEYYRVRFPEPMPDDDILATHEYIPGDES